MNTAAPARRSNNSALPSVRHRVRNATVALVGVALAAAVATGCSGGITNVSDPQALQSGPPWSEQLGATTWYTVPTTSMKDPTPDHTVEVKCGTQTTNGTALYPYIVTDGPNSDDYTYRNLSTKGVWVKSETGHEGSVNGYLTVGNNHLSGDYAFSVAYECSSNDDNNGTFLQSATATNVAAGTATINAEYYNNGTGSGYDVAYEVQYGLSAGAYTQNTGLLKAPMVDSGSGTVSTPLTGLQPGTTYHYRVLENADGSDDTATPNYTADQTFTTPAA